jgi:peptide/nickel transport system ATP-binding protein
MVVEVPTAGPVLPAVAETLAATAVGVTFGGLRPGRRGTAALQDVSLTLPRGAVVGVVGESGCGKTTLSRVLCGLQRPTTGTVHLAGTDLWSVPARVRRRRVAEHVGLVSQDPAASMNPRLTAGAVIEDPLRIHRRGTAADRRRRVAELIDSVQLPRAVLTRRPGELSGGQRQRVAVARALALDPAFLLADEPTSSLDVSLRGQLLDLLADLRRSRLLGILLISHDLQAVRYLADTATVMYRGRVVESGPAQRISDHPEHPYTAALLSAAPALAGPRRRIVLAPGEPSGSAVEPGCPFRPRCWRATDACADGFPPARYGAADDHVHHCLHPMSGPAAAPPEDT